MGHLPKGRDMPDHNVTTHRNDTSRSGAYLAETELTPATVASSQFGKLYERIVNGDVYAQPLYVRGVATPSGTRNLFFIATSHTLNAMFGLPENFFRPPATTDRPCVTMSSDPA